MLTQTHILTGVLSQIDLDTVFNVSKVAVPVAGTAYLAWRNRRYKTVYGAYLETLHTEEGKRIRGNTVVLLRPKLALPLLPIGLHLDGIHFNKARQEREFWDLGIRVLPGQTVSVHYDYMAREQTNGRPYQCDGKFTFQELYGGKYQQAHGSFTRPDGRKRNRLRIVNIAWERIPTSTIKKLIGKSDICSVRDLRRFVDALRNHVGYDDMNAIDPKLLSA